MSSQNSGSKVRTNLHTPRTTGTTSNRNRKTQLIICWSGFWEAINTYKRWFPHFTTVLFLHQTNQSNHFPSPLLLFFLQQPPTPPMEEFKTVVLGAQSCGASFTHCFIADPDTEGFSVEDSCRKQMTVDGRQCLLEIFDTAGTVSVLLFSRLFVFVDIASTCFLPSSFLFCHFRRPSLA